MLKITLGRTKILIGALGVTVVLLLMLACTASAIAPAPSIQTITTSPKTLISGQSFLVSVHVLHSIDNELVKVNVNNVDYGPKQTDNAGNVDISVLVNEAGSYTLTAYATDSSGSYSISNTKDIAITGTTSVPEFPSVAIPVVAILGLFFVVSRKKRSN
jgi:hypothetical protein